VVRISNLIAQREKLRKQFSKEIKLEPRDITAPPADERFLMKAVSVVEDHLKDKNFSLDLFYQEMNRSRSTMFRKLSALTGQSPSEFIRTIRLKRAAKLLEQDFGSMRMFLLWLDLITFHILTGLLKTSMGFHPENLHVSQKMTRFNIKES
jgi:AraC-like DNA-binding protein